MKIKITISLKGYEGEQMFHIALYEPQIAPNTGNAIRLAANNGCHLHLIEPMGFELEAKKLRRAGLDYHDLANVSTHPNFDAFVSQVLTPFAQRRLYALTTRGTKMYTQAQFNQDDVLLFGSETAGLAQSVMEQIPQEQRLVIPMLEGARSLNLSNAIAIVSYEAWRQLGFKMS